MAELKTKVNDASVADFLNRIDNKKRQADAFKVLELMQSITQEEPRMWGSSIIGFGTYRYQYASGREGEWMLTAFSPRKQNLTLYIMAGFERYDELMEKLGKYKTGKSCLYLNKLEDIDMKVLEKLIKASVDHMKKSAT
jgi:hypothetical protein